MNRGQNAVAVRQGFHIGNGFFQPQCMGNCFVEQHVGSTANVHIHRNAINFILDLSGIQNIGVYVVGDFFIIEFQIIIQSNQIILVHKTDVLFVVVHIQNVQSGTMNRFRRCFLASFNPIQARLFFFFRYFLGFPFCGTFQLFFFPEGGRGQVRLCVGFEGFVCFDVGGYIAFCNRFGDKLGINIFNSRFISIGGIPVVHQSGFEGILCLGVDGIFNALFDAENLGLFIGIRCVQIVQNPIESQINAFTGLGYFYSVFFLRLTAGNQGGKQECQNQQQTEYSFEHEGILLERFALNTKKMQKCLHIILYEKCISVKLFL